VQLWRLLTSGVWCVVLKMFTDVSKESYTSIFTELFDLKMEARSSSETPTNIYQTTLRQIWEDSCTLQMKYTLERGHDCALAAQLYRGSEQQWKELGGRRMGFSSLMVLRWMNEKPWKFQRHVSGYTTLPPQKSGGGGQFSGAIRK
jgi:hypothetical protein